jgi:methionyl-tRNA synthetase
MEEATNFVNAFLVNDLANLLQRAINPKLNPAQQYPSGFDPELFESREEEGKQGSELAEQLVTRLEALPGYFCLFLLIKMTGLERLIEHFDRLETNRVIELLIGPVQLANQFFQQQTPWKVVDDRERVDSILFLAYETVRISAIFLQPITPAFSHKLLDT